MRPGKASTRVSCGFVNSQTLESLAVDWNVAGGDVKEIEREEGHIGIMKQVVSGYCAMNKCK